MNSDVLPDIMLSALTQIFIVIQLIFDVNIIPTFQ